LLTSYWVRQREYLLEISRAMTAQLDLDAVLEKVLHAATEILAGQAALIALRQPEGGFAVRAVYGLPLSLAGYFSGLLADIPERADRAVYEVVAGGQVVSRAVLDQRSGGDEWHVVAEVPLKPADEAFVRLRCNGRRPCIADALHLRSASRYNDGAPASDVELAPMDGIVLRRIEGYSVFIPRLAVRE